MPRSVPAPCELEIASGRSALKLITKDINQIKLVGEAVLRDKPEFLGNFKAMYTNLAPLMEQYLREYNDLARLALVEGDVSIFPTPEDVNARKETYSIYYKAIEFHQALNVQPVPTHPPEGSLTQTGLNLSQSISKSRLPKISVPKFSGSLADWPKFKQLFTSMIHENREIPVIEKFFYLNDALAGDPKTFIATFHVDESQYQCAWDALLKRYDNKRLLATTYIEKILDYSPNNSKGSGSLSSLQSFIRVVAETVTAFKNIKIEDAADFIILTLALRKLDSETRRQFETKVVDEDWPKFKELVEFVQGKCRVLQLSQPSSSDIPSPGRSTRSSGKPQILTTTGSSPASQASPNSLCPCRQAHCLYDCPKFKGKPLTERREFIKGKRVCFNCLNRGHSVAECISRGRCLTCRSKHHTLLHDSSFQPAQPDSGTSQRQPQPSERDASSPPPLIASVTGPTEVLLGTAEVLVVDSQGVPQPVRLLVDCGSQFSLITSACAKRLGLSWQATRHSPLGAGQTPLPRVKGRLHCTILSRLQPDRQVAASPLVVANITGHLPTTTLPAESQQAFPLSALADPLFWKPRPIDFLLGNDLFMQILTGNSQPLSGDYGSLPTIFGIVRMGSTKQDTSTSANPICLSLTESPISADLIQKFWEIEEVKPDLDDPTQDVVEEHYQQTHYRDETGRYVVSLSFKEPPDNLEESKHLALTRFHRLEQQLQRKPFLREKYSQFMTEYLDLDHMEPTNNTSAYVIPHHGVFRNDDPKGKIRVVFDASMKTQAGSLNDKLHTGRKLQNDICLVILNFRRHQIAVTADIVKMYRQILVKPDDRKYQHIWWRLTPTSPLQLFELKTITYGTNYAPFAALRTLKQLVYDEGDDYPLAAQALLSDCYVDDIVSGADTLQEALELKSQLQSLLKKGQFPVHKWGSNNAEFLKACTDDDLQGGLSLDPKEGCCSKVLGMSWDPAKDEFSFNVKPVGTQITKRSIISVIARLYDPLGFLAPVLFKAKTILQDAWMSGVGWDEQVPPSLALEWTSFAQQLPCLANIKIQRLVLFQTTLKSQIFGFCDASQRGYAAALYLRAVSASGEVQTSLLKAKTKLAPTKTLSIPRLELSAAHLLVQLKLSIQAFIDSMSISDFNFFSDSTIVLAWINISPHQLKTFVANRVSFIIRNTSPTQWHHISSVENPSDVASRGLYPEALNGNELWWAAPSFLQEEPFHLPSLDADQSCSDVPDLKSGILLVTSDEDWLISFLSHRSKYGPMIRTLSYIFRFVDNLKRPKELRVVGPLRVEEIDRALHACIKSTQLSYFRQDFDHDSGQPLSTRLRTLATFCDEHGLLRVGGRIENSTLTYNAKHPIIIPGTAHLTKLLIDYYHQAYGHLGTRALQAFLRRRFWILRSRQAIRSRLAKCLPCTRLRAQPIPPVMGNLPDARVQRARPFATTGIDYAGPFLCKQGQRRNAPVSKSYLAIFVCFATKAVHLEAVTSLSTDGFLAAFERFIARRGLPSKVISDNGKNFVGAVHVLRDLYTWLKSQETQVALQRSATMRGIQWSFIPPYTPHFGGLWEAAVKSAKYHITRIAKDQPMTYEELYTLFARVEAILNSRPLCALNDDPEYGEYLTPGHFLIGAPLISLPEHDLTSEPLNRLSRWQLIQNSAQHFWNKWSSEYLHSLQKRQKWQHHRDPIKVDDMVLVRNTNSSPLHWDLARVSQLHPGEDGVTRVVSVQSRRGIIRRAIHNLVPLPHLSSPTED